MESFILEFVFRTGLIVVATAVVLRALRIRSAAAQHAVWAGVLLVMMLLPAWIAWGPKAGVPVLPAQPEVVTSAAPVMANAPEAPVLLDALEGPAARRLTWNWEAVFLGVYLFGAVVLLLRLAVGTIRANRLTSASCSSPVTVGFFRPRIILPMCAADWPKAQLDAVLTHEREHVHRRDPLFQWLALFNRAVFWFHPAAWWLERKLSALAEEACDAAVLEHGHDPAEYSEYLLELARAVQQAGTRVNVVAMAMPGSGLPQRITTIIAGVRTPRISHTRMACAVLTCAIPMAVFSAGTLDHMPQLLPLRPLPVRPVPEPPILIAQVQAPAKTPEAKLEFEVASVRPIAQLTDLAAGGGRGGPGTSDPERFTFQGLLAGALRIAYGVDFDQISGPDWLQTEKYEIVAKVPPGATTEQMKAMLQNLLADRFHLSLHHTTKQVTQYELVIARGGLKMKENTDNLPPSTLSDPRMPADKDGYPQLAPGKSGVGMDSVGGLNRWTFRGVPMAYLLFQVGAMLGGTTGPTTYAPAHILDKTGLTGTYDFKLEFSGLIGPGGAFRSIAGQDPPGSGIVDALEKQLGLKLEEKKDPLDVLVIDHADKVPTEN